MFSKLAVLLTATASLSAVLVAATPVPGGSAMCNTGEIYCCNSVQDSKSDNVSKLVALLGISLGEVTGQVGMTCSPITLIGVASGSSCKSAPVCCTHNNFNGLITTGCSPISAGPL